MTAAATNERRVSEIGTALSQLARRGLAGALMLMLASVGLGSTIRAQDRFEGWKGRFVLIESRPDGTETRTSLQLDVRQNAHLEGRYRAVPPGNRLGVSESDRLFRVAINADGDLAEGQITLRVVRKRGGIARKRSTLRLIRNDEIDGFEGSYRFLRFEEPAEEWIEDEEVAVRIVPCCPPLSGPIVLGTGDLKLQIDLAEMIEATPADDVEDLPPGYCHYFGLMQASLSIPLPSIPGSTMRMPALDGVSIEFYAREGADGSDPRDLQDIRLFWSLDGSESATLFERWGLRFALDSVDVMLQVAGDGALQIVGGEVRVQMSAATPDLHLGGPVYLAGDLDGFIGFQWEPNATNWAAGSWSFAASGDIAVEVRASGYRTLASLDLSFRDDGTATGRLTVVPGDRFTVGGIEFTLDTCSLEAEMSFADPSIAFVGGEIRGQVRLPEVASPFKFSIRSTGRTGFEFALENPGEFRLFGGTCSQFRARVRIDLERLALEEVQASLQWQHDKFDGAVRIADLRWIGGRVAAFEGSGRVGLRSSDDRPGRLLELEIAQLSLQNEPGARRLRIRGGAQIGFSAQVSGRAVLRDFLLDLDSGEILSLDLGIELATGPVTATIDASYSGTSLQGTFRGQLRGLVRIDGDFVAGIADDGFAYGYLAIKTTVERGGVPLGNSGLLLTGIGGAVGFNYRPGLGGALPGTVEKGTFYLAGSLALSDAAGAASLQGRIALTLGRTNAIEVGGALQMTRSTPYLFGVLNCRYSLDDQSITGNLIGTATIPQNGSMLSVRQNTLNYSVARGRWALSGRGLGGTLLGNLVVSNGRLSLSGRTADPLDSLRGTLTCAVATEVERSFRAGGDSISVSGNLGLSIWGTPDIAFDRRGVRGTFPLQAHLSGRLTARVDTFLGSATFDATVSARARVVARSDRGRCRVTGSVDIEVSFGIDWAYDYEIDHVF